MADQEYFLVELQVKIPVTLQIKVLAETPEKALKLATARLPTRWYQPPKFHWSRAQVVTGTVKTFGNSVIRWLKHF